MTERDAARIKAARKGAKTRKANVAAMKRWLEIDKPSHEATVDLCNRYLVLTRIKVRFNPRDSGLTLKKGSAYGTLVKVLGTGLIWRVLVDGYKHPQDYYAGFWEIV